MPDIIYFESPDEFRQWLAEHHATATELQVGLYKKGAARTGITWAQAVDQALCFGWIDSVGRRVDDERYTIRFTPRKPKSNWSTINIKRVGELTELGLMQPAGLAAFQARDPKKSRQYSYEERDRPLDAIYEDQLRANTAAWDFFQAQAPSYQRAARWWIMSAKRDETRLKRLATLIEDSENGRRLSQFVSPARQTKKNEVQ